MMRKAIKNRRIHFQIRRLLRVVFLAIEIASEKKADTDSIQVSLPKPFSR